MFVRSYDLRMRFIFSIRFSSIWDKTLYWGKQTPPLTISSSRTNNQYHFNKDLDLFTRVCVYVNLPDTPPKTAWAATRKRHWEAKSNAYLCATATGARGEAKRTVQDDISPCQYSTQYGSEKKRHKGLTPNQNTLLVGSRIFSRNVSSFVFIITLRHDSSSSSNSSSKKHNYWQHIMCA